MQIRLHGVAPESIVDGPGVRYAIFTQGCPHNCVGCHNPSSHNILGGYVKDVEVLFQDIKVNPILSGVTFSGGEPFLQAKPLCKLGRLLKNENIPILTFSGYTLENLQNLAQTSSAITELLDLTDMLIDGPYIQKLYSDDLLFRGSSNQRIWSKKNNSWFLDKEFIK